MQPIHLIQSFPLFEGLSEEEVASMQLPFSLRTYAKKTVLFHEGSPKEAVYFILKGLVKTYKTDENGHENIVSFLKKNDMFPHTSFYDSQPYPATAETLLDSSIMVIPSQAFEQMILTHPTLTINMMKMMSAKIRELQQSLQLVTGQDVQRRIVSFLIKLVEQYEQDKDGSISIPMPMTNQELANAIGTSRETVNRLLNQLRKEQLIEIKSNQLTVKKLDDLLNWS